MPPHGSIEGPFQPFSSIRPSKDQKQNVSTKSVIPGGEILGQLAPSAASGYFFSEFFGMQTLFGRSCLIWPKKSVFEGIGGRLWGLFWKQVILAVLSGLRECQGFPDKV